ncbi:IFNL3 protein, partial [Rhynochetos jubatus]|nr:IFNL3 protein [Rhynochetos jubatus]
MLHLGFIPLLALVLGASLGAPWTTRQKGCSLSKYRFLVPQEQKAVKNMKDNFEDIIPLLDRECKDRLFHRHWRTVQLSMPDRVRLVEEELDLATAMLRLPTTPTFAETRQQPLALFTQALADLRVCKAMESPSHQPSKKLQHWLQKLQRAKNEETTGCLEASVIHHIFQVLNDLQCTALQEKCT